TDHQRLSCDLLKTKILNKKGAYKESLDVAEKAFKENQRFGLKKNMVDALIEMAEAFLRLGKLDECLQSTESGENILDEDTLESVETLKRRAHLRNRKGTVYLVKGERDAALKCFRESLALGEETGDKRYIAAPLQNMGLVYQSKSRFNRALDLFKRSLAIYEELGDKTIIAYSHNNLGMVYWRKGHLDLALDHFKRSLVIYDDLAHDQGRAKIFLNLTLLYSDCGELDLGLNYGLKALDFYEKSENQYELAKIYNNTGIIYLQKGLLHQALDFFNKCLVISRELGIEKDIALSLNNIGTVYYQKGELDRALVYYQESLNIHQKLEEKQAIANSYHNIGGIYKNKGNHEAALDNYKKSLKLKEEIGNDLETAKTVFMLIELMIDNDLPGTDEYMQRLSDINGNGENRIIDQLFRMAKAALLRNGTDRAGLAEARGIYQEITDGETADYELTILSYYKLCEILLDVFIGKGKKRSLEELKDQLRALRLLTEQKNLHGIKLSILLLLSKLELIETNTDEAKSLIGDVLLEAEEMGNERLVDQCNKEIEEITMLELYKQGEEFSSPSNEDLIRLEDQQIKEVVEYLDAVKLQIKTQLRGFD
ncbi:MAG: tetratricopeptide repeat protein, partial [Candidatus Hodarchaeales archaeon]